MPVSHRSWSLGATCTTSGDLRRRRRLTAALLAGVVLVLTPAWLPAGRAGAGTSGSRWVTTWAPSPVPAGSGDTYLMASMPTNQAHNQSVRMVVRTTSPGSRIRIRLTNRYGNRPVTFGPVRVGLRYAGPSVQAGTTRTLHFGGRPSVTIPAGADAASDPISFAVGAGTELVVSLNVIGDSGPVTWHRWANAVTYVSGPGTGDKTAEDSGVSYGSVGLSWMWLDGLDTESSYAGTIVVLGDSITDGWEVLPDQSQTWPDVLAARLEAGPARTHRAVVNAGIAGNQVTGPFTCGLCGPSALTRMNHDAFGLSGVTALIVFEGTNDLGAGRSATTVINGLAKVVAAARQHGLRVYGATITPRADTGWRPSMEAGREAVNQWIRTSGHFDAVFDFDRALRDPVDPHRLLAAFDSGDSVHPNLVGLKTLGDSIDISRFG
jgi:lysophospholipase L1-like esterase